MQKKDVGLIQFEHQNIHEDLKKKNVLSNNCLWDKHIIAHFKTCFLGENVSIRLQVDLRQLSKG